MMSLQQQHSMPFPDSTRLGAARSTAILGHGGGALLGYFKHRSAAVTAGVLGADATTSTPPLPHRVDRVVYISGPHPSPHL